MRPRIVRPVQAAKGHAPGRINLIGEHTDYNDGLVLPIALALGVSATACARDDDRAHLSTDATAPREVDYALGNEAKDGTWADRVRGLTSMLRQCGRPIGGFDLAVTSTLPSGAGLGSSAAFTIAAIRALATLFTLSFEDDDVVRLAHDVENGPFVGARSGLLDQLASVYGSPTAALLIDLRDRTRESVALPRDLALAVIDSGTRHEHATGGYNERRRECEAAARHLGVASLRELETSPLLDVLDRLPPPLDRRVRHVLTENERVRQTVDALGAADLPRLGQLLDESHRSLRDDYEVSTPDLERLIAAAHDDERVLGARLVGGGFGGSVLVLARRAEAEAAARRIVASRPEARVVAFVP